MTKLLESALEAVRQLPTDTQDEIARAMLALAGRQGETVILTPDERARLHVPRARRVCD